MDITALHIFFASCFFLCVGSAIGAYLFRTPKYEEYIWRREAHFFLDLTFEENEPVSFFKGRSHCPTCQHSLGIRDLIPLFSFLLNRARCKYCNTAISWSYFKIELLTLLLCLPLLWIAGDLTEFILLGLIFSTLFTISLIDWRHQWIPDQLNLVLLGLALLHALIIQPMALQNSIIGMLSGYLFIVSLRQVYLFVRNIEAIGLGDAKLLAALGAWQGLQGLFFILFFASVLGIFYAIIHKKARTQTIPFGPFLAIAAILNFIFNSPITNYLFTHSLKLF